MKTTKIPVYFQITNMRSLLLRRIKIWIMPSHIWTRIHLNFSNLHHDLTRRGSRYLKAKFGFLFVTLITMRNNHLESFVLFFCTITQIDCAANKVLYPSRDSCLLKTTIIGNTMNQQDSTLKNSPFQFDKNCLSLSSC